MGLGIRNFGAAMRGAGDAATLYEEQQRKRAEAEFAAKQRARQEKAWGEEDAYKSDVRSIAMPGAEVVEGQTFAPDDMETPSQVKRGIQTEKKYMDQLAGAQQRAGKVTEALQTRALGQQQEDAAYSRYQREVVDSYWKAKRLERGGQLGPAMQLIAKAYERDNDGHKIVIQDGQWGVAGPDAKFVRPLQPITAEGVRELTDQMLEYSSPEMWKGYQERNYKQGQLGVQQGQLGVQQREAAVREAVAPSQIRQNDASASAAITNAQANVTNANSNARNAATAEARLNIDSFSLGTPYVTLDPESKQYTQATPVLNKRRGTTEWTYMAMPKGWVPPKQANILAPHEAAAMQTIGKMAEADPAFGQDQRAMRRVYDALTSLSGEDPMIKRYAGVGPPGGAAASAPKSATTRGIQAPTSGNEGRATEDSDPMEREFNIQTQAIEAGRLRDYSAPVKAWMDTRRNGGDGEAMRREQERLLRKPVY